MDIIKPHIFISYSRKDQDFIHRLRTDLFRSGVQCWLDVADIRVGERLNPAIEAAISDSTLLFAYVTENYLESKWCMKELRYALELPTVTVAPYVDSEATLHRIPVELLDEISFGILAPEDYTRSLLELAGRCWVSLQMAERVVGSDDHILAGPAIFDSAGYSREDIMKRARRELIIAGPNLRSWLSDNESKQGLVGLVKRRNVRVTLILATYETLRPISPEGAIHLRESVKDISKMLNALEKDERELMSAHFHVGASTLSAVFIDPATPEGLLFFSPRWAIQFLPQDRLTCVIDKRINSEDLYKAIYNGVLLMTQGDAKTIEDMLASL